MPKDEIASDNAPMVQTLKQRLSGFETEEGRRKGLAFEPEASDVFVTTTPKAGTTWMQQIVHQLRTGGDMDFEEISGVVPWIELAADLKQDLQADQVATPRCFKTHCWYDHCPKGGRYIVVARDPHDVALSFFKFFEGWFFQPEELDVDTFVREFWLARGVPASEMQNASYFHFTLSWWRHRHDANVLWVHFEDMKADLRATVERVARFMGVEPTEALLTEVTHRASFEYMRDHGEHFNEKLSKRERNEACGLPLDAGSTSSKVRSGGVGGSKASMSEELRAAISARWAEVVTPETGYADYSAMRRAMAPPATEG